MILAEDLKNSFLKELVDRIANKLEEEEIAGAEMFIQIDYTAVGSTNTKTGEFPKHVGEDGIRLEIDGKSPVVIPYDATDAKIKSEILKLK